MDVPPTPQSTAASSAFLNNLTAWEFPSWQFSVVWNNEWGWIMSWIPSMPLPWLEALFMVGVGGTLHTFYWALLIRNQGTEDHVRGEKIKVPDWFYLHLKGKEFVPISLLDNKKIEWEARGKCWIPWPGPSCFQPTPHPWYLIPPVLT